MLAHSAAIGPGHLLAGLPDGTVGIGRAGGLDHQHPGVGRSQGKVIHIVCGVDLPRGSGPPGRRGSQTDHGRLGRRVAVLVVLTSPAATPAPGATPTGGTTARRRAAGGGRPARITRITCITRITRVPAVAGRRQITGRGVDALPDRVPTVSHLNRESERGAPPKRVGGRDPYLYLVPHYHRFILVAGDEEKTTTPPIYDLLRQPGRQRTAVGLRDAIGEGLVFGVAEGQREIGKLSLGKREIGHLRGARRLIRHDDEGNEDGGAQRRRGGTASGGIAEGLVLRGRVGQTVAVARPHPYGEGLPDRYLFGQPAPEGAGRRLKRQPGRQGRVVRLRLPNRQPVRQVRVVFQRRGDLGGVVG